MAPANLNKAPRQLGTQQSVNIAIKSICDIMRRSNCAGALQYVPELTWILFLRILDERETRETEASEAVRHEFTPSLEAPYRWQDWAAPDGAKRRELRDSTLGAFFDFVNDEEVFAGWVVVRHFGVTNIKPPRVKAEFFLCEPFPHQGIGFQIFNLLQDVKL